MFCNIVTRKDQIEHKEVFKGSSIYYSFDATKLPLYPFSSFCSIRYNIICMIGPLLKIKFSDT